jgi:hypothetical protein
MKRGTGVSACGRIGVGCALLTARNANVAALRVADNSTKNATVTSRGSPCETPCFKNRSRARRRLPRIWLFNQG